MENKTNSFKLPTMTGEAFSTGGREGGKTAERASQFSEMIVSGNYPSNVNSFQRNEINELWKQGKTLQAVNRLQQLLTPEKQGKTLL